MGEPGVPKEPKKGKRGGGGDTGAHKKKSAHGPLSCDAKVHQRAETRPVDVKPSLNPTFKVKTLVGIF